MIDEPITLIQRTRAGGVLAALLLFSALAGALLVASWYGARAGQGASAACREASEECRRAGAKTCLPCPECPKPASVIIDHVPVPRPAKPPFGPSDF